MDLFQRDKSCTCSKRRKPMRAMNLLKEPVLINPVCRLCAVRAVFLNWDDFARPPPPPGDIWQCLEALAAVTPGGGGTPLALHGRRPGMLPNPTRHRTQNLWPKMSVGLRLRNCDLWVNWGETLPSVVIGAPPRSTFHPNNSLSPATLENPATIGIGRFSQVCS